MEPILSIALLGPYQVKQHGETVQIKSAKSRALLAYLAVEPASIHTGETLAALLWEKGGTASLDQEILNLRQSLAIPDLIHREKGEVRLNPPAGYWFDVAEFETLLGKCAAHKHDPQAHLYPELCQQCAQWRWQAIHLYRGDFLKGLSIKKGSPEFDEWLQSQQDHLRGQAAGALHSLARYHEWRGELEQAQSYVRRQLALEPWREEAHRQLMALLAHSGQRSAALAQYKRCRQHLADELDVEPSPETTLLYERILATGKTPRHNLPTQATRFVGRQQESAEIAAMLAHPDCRLLTLVGIGGVGKTRLGLQIAELKRYAFLDGVWLAPLAGLESADSLVTAIADALGFAISGSREPKAQLFDYLRQKELLLVLDNFEHLLAGTGLIGEILRHAPAVKILVTSRARLNLSPWEWIFELAGLAVPAVESENNIEHYSAVHLFVQHAKQAQHAFSLGPANAPAIARLCRLVEGMPLAIELAAAWVRVLSCQKIVAELQQGIDLLTTSSPEVLDRHRNMRAVFEHSWGMLSASEQMVLSILSIFQGGFSLEAARCVADASLPVLVALIDRSLLRHASAGRYEMHELLRQFAAEKLAGLPAVQAQSEDEHCHYYATFLQDREAKLTDARREETLTEIHTELENVRAAWRLAVHRGNLRAIGSALKGLMSFYKQQDWFWEGEEAAGKAVAMLEAVGNTAEEQAEVHRLLGMALARQADFCAQLALYEKAKDLADKSMVILTDCGARSETAFPLEVLSYVAFRLDQYEEATRQAAESLDLYQQYGDKFGAAQCLNRLGILSLRLRELEEATQYFQRSLKLFRELGARREIAHLLFNLGGACWMEERYRDLHEYRQQSLALYREINDQGGVALSLAGLGSTFYYLGMLQESIEYSLESLPMRRQTGDRLGEALTLFNLGRTSGWMGDYAAAEQYHQQGLLLSSAINSRWITAHILNCLGELAMAQGDDAQAAHQFEASHKLFEEIKFQTGVVALANLGEAMNASGEAAKAEQLLQKALAVSESIDFKEGIALSKKNLGVVARSRGAYADAQLLFQESYKIYGEIDHGLGTALALLHLAEVMLALHDGARAERQFHAVLKRAMEMQALPIMFSSLVGIAALNIRHAKNCERSLELLAFVVHQSATTKQARDKAQALLARLETKAPDSIVTRAKERGRTRNWKDVVAEIRSFGGDS